MRVWVLIIVCMAPTVLVQGCYFPEVTLNEADQREVAKSLITQTSQVKPKIVVNAVIEDQARLIGIDINRTSARPNDVVEITYYIESLSDEPKDNEIFVHLQGRRSKMWQNLDHTPVRGLLPLRKLKRGQIVKDVQRFRVKAGYPPGGAKLYWGLFRGKQRLKITNHKEVKHDGKNRVELGRLVILPARPPVEVNAYKAETDEPIIIDGQLTEQSWANAKWTKRWMDPLGRTLKNKRYRGKIPNTRAKLIWQPDALYIAIEAIDKDIWATLTKRDSNTWEEEVVEVFLDPDGDKRNYLELQVTPANVVFDARFAYRRSDLKTARAWDYQGWVTKVHIDGTLNDRQDRDRKYVVEMKLPLKTIPGAPKQLKINARPWRINMFRFDWNEAPKGGQRAAALSPTYVGDFHALDAFAKLNFKPKPQNKTKIEPIKEYRTNQIKMSVDSVAPAAQPLK